MKAVKPRSKLQWLKRLTADLDDDEDSSDTTPQPTPQKPPRTQEKNPPLKEPGLEDEKTPEWSHLSCHGRWWRRRRAR